MFSLTEGIHSTVDSNSYVIEEAMTKRPVPAPPGTC